MSVTTSFYSHDFQPITVIPVIASFDTEGHIAPLYVRIRGHSYRVLSYWTSQKFAHNIEFHCTLDVDHVRQPLLLTYYKAEDTWAIPKLSENN